MYTSGFTPTARLESLKSAIPGRLVMADPLRGTPTGRIPVKLHKKVCLVQTEDALLAEELLARKKLAQDIVGRLTDCILLVRPGRAEAVLQELQKMGHTPQVASKAP